MAPRVRLRFRTKVWAALCGVAAAALAIALLIAQDAALGRARAETRARFDRTLAAFHELQQLRARYVSAEIDALSRANPQLRTVLSTASLAGEDLGLGGARPEDALHDANLRLQSALPSLALDPKLALFALADADGRLVFSRADPERYGADLRELGLVRKVGEGARATWIWLDGDAQVDGARLAPAYPSPALYLVRGEPVVFGDVVHGIVLLGEPLDRELLESLRAISGVDLALVSRGRAIATTLSTAQAAQLGARLAALALAEARPQPMAELQLGSERFLALRAELDPGTPLPDASFVLLTSLAPELAFVRDLRQTLAAVGLALFAVALAVGYALARGITDPLLALARAARRIGGGDLDARVEIATGDEVESLGEAFNEMAAGLRERELIKSTLERYVSKSVAAELLRDPAGLAARAHRPVRRPRRVHAARRGAPTRGGGGAAERVLRRGLRRGAGPGRHGEGVPGRRRGRILGRADRAARPRPTRRPRRARRGGQARPPARALERAWRTGAWLPHRPAQRRARRR